MNLRDEYKYHQQWKAKIFFKVLIKKSNICWGILAWSTAQYIKFILNW